MKRTNLRTDPSKPVGLYLMALRSRVLRSHSPFQRYLDLLGNECEVKPTVDLPLRPRAAK